MDFILDSPSQQGPQASAGMPSGSGSVAGGAASSVAGQAAGSNQGSGSHAILWTKTQQLPEEAFRQLHSIYGDHFPLEARHHLAGKAEFQF